MTILTERHCGYKNYETFTVAMDLSNDSDHYNRTLEFLYEIEGEFGHEEETAFRDFVEEMYCVGMLDGVLSTLVYASLDRVDWEEVAQDFDEIVGILKGEQS